ncbi:nucleotidyltransferase domain-containing protein [Roseivirga pacifica]|uniref:nucleotidyltransferase domain-containing protein n=1 Tax=Roseivirga pacifica TaxID=1267423 RepID=UPI00227C9921|nr:nucleotidyltransferase domain-containing protein [Roseivirga pacifica]
MSLKSISLNNYATLKEWLNEVIRCSNQKILNLHAIVGGSHAKGVADFFSDIDLCLIGDQKSIDTLIMSVRMNSRVIIEDTDRFGHCCSVIFEGIHLDVHCISLSVCKKALINFNSGKDLSNSTQDFLWNLANGIVIFSKGSDFRFDIDLSQDIVRSLLSKYLKVLTIHKLDVYLSRNDTIQQWESLLTISKTLLNIGYLLNHELFWGYKHSQQRISSFDPRVRDVLSFLFSVKGEMDIEKSAILKDKIKTLKESIINQLESSSHE